MALAQPSQVKVGKRHRLVMLDDCRAAAISLVVGFHILFLAYGRITVTRNALAILTDSGTMMFVILAGFMLQWHSAHFVFRDFLWQKVKNVFCPYAVATFLLIFLRGLRDGEALSWRLLLKWAKALLNGGAGAHLWFIPMLAIFFFLAPVFLEVNRRRWLLPAILTLILPFVLGRGRYFEIWKNTLFFLPFFLLGMAMAVHFNTIQARLRQSWLWSLGLAFCVSMALVFFPEPEWLQTIGRMVFCFMILALAARFSESLHQTRIGLALNGLSAYSYGIYLYHNSLIGLVFVPCYRRWLSGFGEGWQILALVFMTALCLTISALALKFGRAVLRALGVRSTRIIIGC
ncbi:MAG: acyltransferase family protein [Lentisphaeria bacterium]|jgi:peptidoglycan/LPS O-acetylase OafA/YrhL